MNNWNILNMRSFQHIFLCIVFMQWFGQPLGQSIGGDNLIASITKIISKCQLNLPPEERNITIRIKCIGTENENGELEEIDSKTLQGFGLFGAKLCGGISSIECVDELLTTTPVPSTTTTTTTTTSTPPPLPTPTIHDPAGTCVDIIFIIDASCTVAKHYQRKAIELIEEFVKELKFRGDETTQDPRARAPVVRVPFSADGTDMAETVDRIFGVMSDISLDQTGLSNVAVIPFHATALNTTIPFQNDRSNLLRGLQQLMNYERVCKTFGDTAYDKAAEYFSAIPDRNKNAVVVIGDGRNTGTKHQALSEEAMRKLKNKQNADVIWVETPTKILNKEKTEEEQMEEIVRGQMHIKRHVKNTQIFDINDDDLTDKLIGHFSQFYVCDKI